MRHTNLYKTRTERPWFVPVAIAMLTFLATTLLGPSLPASATTEHCDQHVDMPKVEAEKNPMTIAVLDSVTGELIEVVVTLDGTNVSIEAVDGGTELQDASWCIKAGTTAVAGSGLEGQSTSMNKPGTSAKEISYVVVYSVSTGAAMACEWGDVYSALHNSDDSLWPVAESDVDSASAAFGSEPGWNGGEHVPVGQCLVYDLPEQRRDSHVQLRDQ